MGVWRINNPMTPEQKQRLAESVMKEYTESEAREIHEAYSKLTPEDFLKTRYFDIIKECGLTVLPNSNPCHCPGMPLSIKMSIRDNAGVLFSSTAYGENLMQVCKRADDFLTKHDWHNGGKIT